MLNSDKRKHNTLTLKLKAEILDRLNKGEKISSLANYYNVGRTTIYDINKKREKIERFVQLADKDARKRQTLKSGKNPQVEEVLYKWFLQERDKDVHITAELMREQAKFFYRQITNKDDFKASDGWYDKFKHRFGIRSLNSSYEELAETTFVSPLPSNDQDKSCSDTEVEVKTEKMEDDEILEVILTEIDGQEDQDCFSKESSSLIDPKLALSSFRTCIKWAEQNGVSAEDIVTLRKLKGKVRLV